MDIFVGSAVVFVVALSAGLLVVLYLQLRARRSREFAANLVFMALLEKVMAQQEKLHVAQTVLEKRVYRILPEAQEMWRVTAVAPDTLRLELLSTFPLSDAQKEGLASLITEFVKYDISIEVALVMSLPPAQ